MQQQILEAIQAFLNLGAAVMMPVFITILGLILGQKFGKAFRAGLTIGIGFIGVFAIIGILGETVGPAAQALTERFGLSLTAIDMGWPTGAGIAWSMPTAWAIIPLCVVFNIIFIILRQTKTIHIDVWNYWNQALCAALIYVATENLWLSWGFAMFQYFLLFKVGDWAAPIVQDPEVYNFPNVSWPWWTMPLAPIGFFFNKVIDYIPWLNRIEADPDTLQKRLGLLGEASMLGLIIGLLLGLLAGYNVGGILTTGVTLAAVMLLLPRMIGVMMEGLLPLADGVQEFMAQRFEGREFYIGLDGAISAGYVPLLATSMIVVGVAPLLAMILPGNKTLPLADLAIAWAMGMWAAAPSKGNIVRGTIIHLLLTVVCLYVASFAAPYWTGAAEIAGIDVGGITVTVLTAGGMFWPIVFLVFILFFQGTPQIFGYAPATMLIITITFLVIYFAMWWWVRKEPERIAATPREELVKQFQVAS
jgi:PTS system galactitol-specific IIC component